MTINSQASPTTGRTPEEKGGSPIAVPVLLSPSITVTTRWPAPKPLPLHRQHLAEQIMELWRTWEREGKIEEVGVGEEDWENKGDNWS